MIIPLIPFNQYCKLINILVQVYISFFDSVTILLLASLIGLQHRNKKCYLVVCLSFFFNNWPVQMLKLDSVWLVIQHQIFIGFCFSIINSTFPNGWNQATSGHSCNICSPASVYEAFTLRERLVPSLASDLCQWSYTNFSSKFS